MKDLILYYSLGGKTRLYAEKLASETNADLREIEDGKNGFTAFVPGCIQSLSGARTKIKPPGVDMTLYTQILLASPVWAGFPAPAINAAAELLPPGKKVGIILLSASGKGDGSKLQAIVKSRGCEVVGLKNVKSSEV